MNEFLNNDQSYVSRMKFFEEKLINELVHLLDDISDAIPDKPVELKLVSC